MGRAHVGPAGRSEVDGDIIREGPVLVGHLCQLDDRGQSGGAHLCEVQFSHDKPPYTRRRCPLSEAIRPSLAGHPLSGDDARSVEA